MGGLTKKDRMRRALIAAVALTWAGLAGSQPPPPSPGGPLGPGGQPPPGFPPPPVAPSKPAALPHMAAAKRAAGTLWTKEYAMLCEKARGDGVGYEGATIEPQMIFDNLALIGDRGTVMFVFKTSAGVLLIDSGYSSKVDSVLLSSLAKLNIDPATVKSIVITHGHPDHYGGALYFQTHYGTHILASAADWELIEGTPPSPPPGMGPPQEWMQPKPPARDQVIADGEKIRLGDLTLQAYLIPGHTPGALGFVFPVKDHGRAHTAAIFGGTILGDGMVPLDSLRQYVSSLAHFGQIAQTNSVDVELQNHPVFDDTFTKAAALATRKPGDPNPFVVGVPAYQNFLTVMSECAQATIAQRQ